MNNPDTCQACEQPLWLEGTIGDSIALCHACYSNDTLRAFDYLPPITTED